MTHHDPTPFPHDPSYECHDLFEGCTLEELKASVERGYRHFWRARGQEPPAVTGFKSAMKHGAVEGMAKKD